MNFRGSRLGFWFRRRPVSSNNVLVMYQPMGNEDIDPLLYVWPNIRDEEIAAGNIPELIIGYDSLPTSFAKYDHIWDISYATPFIIPNSDVSFPVDNVFNYLLEGGSICFIGENANFLERDDSIATFISNTGGGDVLASTDYFIAYWGLTIQPQFLLQNNQSAMTIDAPGVFLPSYTGTGTPWTSELSGGGVPTGLYPIVCWEEGSLSNTTPYNSTRGGPPVLGTILVVLDVNMFDKRMPNYSSDVIQNMIATLHQL